MEECTKFVYPQLYRIDDTGTKPGCFDILGNDLDKDLVPQDIQHDQEMLCYLEAHQYNSQNFGIFWAVNEFVGSRKKENLKKLRAWFVECDTNNKQKTLRQMQNSLIPSLIVESKRGYHAYWFCDDSAQVEEYRDIIEFRLIPHFEGDPNAKDVSRILRVPGYFHCKDPHNPFLVKTIHHDPLAYYSQDEMISFFKLTKDKEKQIVSRKELKEQLNLEGDLFQKIYDLNCKDALERLSGCEEVNYEKYTFKKTSSGNLNIMVDGSGSACWIDRSMRIGSTDKGGPTIWQWIRWFGHSDKQVYQIIKKYFPELFYEV